MLYLDAEGAPMSYDRMALWIDDKEVDTRGYGFNGIEMEQSPQRGEGRLANSGLTNSVETQPGTNLAMRKGFAVLDPQADDL
jgi:hypothetical protein